MRKRVLIVCGGKSAEHEVSLVSALSVARALDRDRFEPVIVAIDRTGRWLLPGETRALLDRPMGHMPGLAETREALIDRAREEVFLRPSGAQGGLVDTARAGAGGSPLAFDVVLPLVHGTNGEDGKLQGLFELANVPYAGAGVLGSAIGMDKDVAKRLLREAGLPVVPYFAVRAGRWEDAADRAEREFGFPFFVKPANSGSSVGVHKVKRREEARPAFQDAFRFDSKVLAEQACPGQEVECAVLGNDAPEASVVGEILPSHEFYDYAAKYVDEHGAQLIIPARLAPATAARVQELALRAFAALECEGMARVDFFVTRDAPEGVFLNEVNTIPGFTPISMYPRLWQASGLAYPALLARLIELGQERHERKQGLVVDLMADTARNGQEE
jgi:D-alanine-D-alanine ligase